LIATEEPPQGVEDLHASHAIVGDIDPTGLIESHSVQPSVRGIRDRGEDSRSTDHPRADNRNPVDAAVAIIVKVEQTTIDAHDQAVRIAEAASNQRDSKDTISIEELTVMGPRVRQAGIGEIKPAMAVEGDVVWTSEMFTHCSGGQGIKHATSGGDVDNDALGGDHVAPIA